MGKQIITSLVLILLSLTAFAQRDIGTIYRDSRGFYYIADKGPQEKPISFFLERGIKINKIWYPSQDVIFNIPEHLVEPKKIYYFRSQNDIHWSVDGQTILYIRGKTDKSGRGMSTIKSE